MSRPNGAWVPDGRAKAIRADCEASLEALGGLEIDLYLLHTPDPRTPWSTSVRALARLVDEGLVARVGVCNVSRAQLDEAIELAPIAAVQVGLSVLDDTALRGGVVDRCAELGIAVIAHSPLGGPRRVRQLSKHAELAAIAGARGVTEAEAALAWVLALGPHVMAIPGARRPNAARSAVRAASIDLTDDERRRIGGGRRRAGRHPVTGDVVLVMGVPGAGKSLLADGYVNRGYLRLNRDEAGGSLRDLAGALERRARKWCERGGSRQHVPHARVAQLRRGSRRAPRRCGAVRLAGHAARTGSGEPRRAAARAVRRASDAGAAQDGRALRGGPAVSDAADEGLPRARASGRRRRVFVDRAHCVRACSSRRLGRLSSPPPIRSRRSRSTAQRRRRTSSSTGVLAATSTTARDAVAGAQRVVSGLVEGAICPHPGGPPVCWCRPPLPGLPLAFAHRHGVDPTKSVVVGSSASHRTLANALGARFVDASA